METNITVPGPLPETFANATFPLCSALGDVKACTESSVPPLHWAPMAGTRLGYRRRMSDSTDKQTAGATKTINSIAFPPVVFLL